MASNTIAGYGKYAETALTIQTDGSGNAEMVISVSGTKNVADQNVILAMYSLDGTYSTDNERNVYSFYLGTSADESRLGAGTIPFTYFAMTPSSLTVKFNDTNSSSVTVYLYVWGKTPVITGYVNAVGTGCTVMCNDTPVSSTWTSIQNLNWTSVTTAVTGG